VAGALAALDLLRSSPERVDKLQRNARVLRDSLRNEGLNCGDSETQIVPLVVGGASAAMAACEKALRKGVFAQAIRPPTVPDGTSRLRLAVMASHTSAELRQAAKVLAGVVPAQPQVPQPEAAPGIYDGLAEAA
jgi:glycine C-acetyltransferase/8-amino-7-oxononanoate synthase